MEVNCILANSFMKALDAQLEIVKKGLKCHRKQIFVVPDRFSLSMEKLVMEKLDLKASFDIDVLTFPRLANYVIGDFAGKEIISKLDAVVIIQLLLKRNEEKFVCFNKTAKNITFAEVLFDSIAQIKSCNITPTQIKVCAEKLQNQSLKQKMLDIALVYQLYEDFIQDKFLDSNNRLNVLCEKLKFSKQFENCDVHFCRFDDLTGQGIEIFKNLVLKSNSVSIGILEPNSNQLNSYIYNSKFKEAVLSTCNALKVKPNIIVEEKNLNDVNEHILQNVFALNKKCLEVEKYENAPQILSAQNINNEIEFIAKKILWLVHNGARFSDFNVICSDFNGYENIIEKEFNKFKIPFWLDKNFELNKTEGYKFINNAIMCIKHNFLLNDVLKFAFNALSNLDSQQKEILDTVAKKFGVVGNMWLKPLENKFNDPNFEIFEESKMLLLNSVTTLKKNFENSKTVSDFVNSLQVFMQESNLEEKLENLALKFLNEGNLKQESILRQTYAKLDNVLNQISKIIGGEETDFQEFLSLLNAAVSIVEISPLPMSLDCVFVGQILSSIFTPTKYCFILGANEGKLPAMLQDVGIISDTEIKSMQDLPLSPTIEELNQRTRIITQQNFVISDNLCVTFPLNQGKDTLFPSSLVKELSAMFNFKGFKLPIASIEQIINDSKVFGSEEARLCFNFATPDNLVLSLIQQNTDENVLLTAKEFLNKLKLYNSLSVLESDNKIIENLKQAEKLFFAKDSTKISQLESYFSCPFKHYAEYGLKLKEREVNNIEARQVGDILHAVAENYVNKSRNKKLNEDEIRALAYNIFDIVIEQKEYYHLLSGTKNRALINGLKNESARICLALNNHLVHSSFKPKFTEAVFGDPKFVPIQKVVTPKNITLKIKGKVDRVDFWNDYVRVIDYKTGKHSSEFKKELLYVGTKIQLFVYMWAILKGFNNQNLKPSGVYLMPLHNEYSDTKLKKFERYKLNGVSVNDIDVLLAQDDQVNYENPKSELINFSLSTSKEVVAKGEMKPKNSNNLISSTQLKQMIEYSVKILAKAIDEICEGYIEAKPLENVCKFCKAKTFCSFFKQTLKDARNIDFVLDENSFKGDINE